jgi:DNA processing protein
MKVHPHWKELALGLQVLGWNHGEWFLALIHANEKRDPRRFPLEKLELPAEVGRFELWSQEWLAFLEQNGTQDIWKQSQIWKDWAEQKQWFWYSPWESEYPSSFREEDDFPLIVWLSARLQQRSSELRVAVVGSREASAYGMFACASIVKELVQSYDCAIVSGCARGIDMSAHKQALSLGGKTYGFVACGASFIPSWQKEIFSQGCLVSIFPPNARAQKWFFAQRNKYLSRFSCGVLVIEASLRSGTLLTAHSALEQGRPLAVVTHPIFAPNWKGVRELIELGAQIVSTGQECLEVFVPEKLAQQKGGALQGEVLAQAQTKEEREILSFLFEQGGNVLEQSYPDVLTHKKAFFSLVERGVIVRQAGVVLLSCMIQS